MVGNSVLRRFAAPRLLSLLLLLPLITACATYDESPLPNLGGELAPFEEIVYIALDGDIRTVDRDGTTDVPVARASLLGPVDGARFSHATWSPDGRRIAFVATLRREGEEATSNLYIADSEAGSISLVHEAGAYPPFYLYWAPGSQRISFLTADGDSESLALQIVGDAGENYSVLGTGSPYYWDWSPTGETIFAHVGGVDRRGEPGSILRLLSVNNGAVAAETLQLETIAFQAPEYSPNGEYIAAAVEDFGGGRRLMLLTSNGQPIRALATLRGQVAFSWSPDGSRIAYIDGLAAPYGGVAGRLHVAGVSAFAQTISWNGFGSALDAPTVGAFFWSPDGEKIAYFEPVFAQARNGRPQLVFRMKIYYVEEERTVTIGPFLPTPAFARQLVPYFDQYERSGTIWSPDSRFVVINAMTREDRPGIYVVPATGVGAPQVVAEGVLPFWAPR
jgi:TolB protein